jgi:lysophospholipase L1-like esterase
VKALNVLLSIVISILLFVFALEGGLRLIGMGPKDTIHEFDSKLGWVKSPEAVGKYSTSEFDVTFKISEQGLRDDLIQKEKFAGTWRGMALGDSFVLGYTVDREDLFVDMLEQSVKADNQANDIVNAGTEGWSTDQEVLWFLEHGKSYNPDLVLLFPYENDLFWNGQTRYGRFPKPRFGVGGEIETEHMQDPGAKPWFERYAIGMPLKPLLAKKQAGAPPWSPDGSHTLAGPNLERAAYFHGAPDFMRESVERTRAALTSLKQACAEIGADLVIVPIPNKSSVSADAQAVLAQSIGVVQDMWSAEKPVDTFLGLAKDLGIRSLDARAALKASAAGGRALYFERDWHFNPAGNRAFASFLQANLGDALPSASAPVPTESSAPADRGIPTWGFVFAALLLVLGTSYGQTYKDENRALAFLKVGLLLSFVFTIVLGGQEVLGGLSPRLAQLLGTVFIIGILGFVLYKLGRRTGTVLELFSAFVQRGHWYLMPLVVILLTIGSLLVVAASSPLVAPFIYTLF